MDINPTAKATTEEVAHQINQLMGDEGDSIEEKIAIRRELDTLIRWRSCQSTVYSGL
ncbi:hypothetical protein [Larkinella sp. C7]|jgi:hypothetical protein|uniref:hypothetical protein n=1 Tax=Larkinella sp. C7 TaxID=2576607 RepID=UPI001487354C|nr:hypothetical protein [Larkinella sp. C7]